MRRLALVLVVITTFVAVPLAAEAQPAAKPVIGFGLSASSAAEAGWAG